VCVKLAPYANKATTEHRERGAQAQLGNVSPSPITHRSAAFMVAARSVERPLLDCIDYEVLALFIAKCSLAYCEKHILCEELVSEAELASGE